MKRLTLLTLFISLFFAINFSFAQDQDIQLNLQPDHEMKIDGDANVRSWDAEVKTINADFVMRAFDINDLSSLTSDHFKTMELTIPVNDIESDSGRLTRNLQGYLKGDDHPQITFTLNNINNVEVNGNSATITADGTINAAGVDHNTTMTVNATFNGNSVTFSGEQELLMTDFNIDPPTAVMGTIRARDEIRIPYTLTFSL
ncbi:MAG: YceI family protein [Balneolaceae bacterium]